MPITILYIATVLPLKPGGLTVGLTSIWSLLMRMGRDLFKSNYLYCTCMAGESVDEVLEDAFNILVFGYQHLSLYIVNKVGNYWL